jgi:hypothetical protein
MRSVCTESSSPEGEEENVDAVASSFSGVAPQQGFGAIALPLALVRSRSQKCVTGVRGGAVGERAAESWEAREGGLSREEAC